MGVAIRALIQAAMGMPDKSVRPWGQSAPAGRTSDEFATVNVRETDDAAKAEYQIVTQDDGSTVEAIAIPQYITASVNFYRGPSPQTDASGMPIYTSGAYDRASRLPKRLQLTQFTEMMRSMGLGYIDSSKPRNLAGLADGHWESRGQVDIYFSAIAVELAPIGTFAQIGDVGIKVETPDGTIHERTL